MLPDGAAAGTGAGSLLQEQSAPTGQSGPQDRARPPAGVQSSRSGSGRGRAMPGGGRPGESTGPEDSMLRRGGRAKTGGEHMTSIKDIARSCGVNPATVSRALNGRKGVSEKVRERILRTAQRLNYSRNTLAAGLITRKSGIVGFVVPDIANPFYASVAKGVKTVLEQEGYSIFLCDSSRSLPQERHYFEMLCNYHVEGVVLISVTAGEADLEIFTRNGIRVVCADNYISSRYSAVINDNYHGTCELMEHLVRDCRIKKLVCVMGRAEASTTRQRLQGCLDTLKRLGCPEILCGVLNIDATYQSGYDIMAEVMRLQPECVFAINDTVALGMISYCQHQGIRIPEELRLAGFDDIPQASMISVPLTTVHQRKFVLGQKAAAQLLVELKNPDAPAVCIELLPKLMIRESCGEKLLH